MKTYVTSDLHFGHKNMCGKDSFIDNGRKVFQSVEEMNKHLVAVHNKVVTNADETIILGDMSLNVKPNELFLLLSAMKGSFIIVKGNHDNSKQLKFLSKYNFKLPNGKDKFTFHEVGFIKKENGLIYHFTHYPMLVGSTRAKLRNICGHIHELPAPSPTVINVGIDSPEVPRETFGEPVLLAKVYEILEEKVAEGLKTFVNNHG